jgi:hypothetical protein
MPRGQHSGRYRDHCCGIVEEGHVTVRGDCQGVAPAGSGRGARWPSTQIKSIVVGKVVIIVAIGGNGTGRHLSSSFGNEQWFNSL